MSTGNVAIERSDSTYAGWSRSRTDMRMLDPLASGGVLASEQDPESIVHCTSPPRVRDRWHIDRRRECNLPLDAQHIAQWCPKKGETLKLGPLDQGHDRPRTRPAHLEGRRSTKIPDDGVRPMHLSCRSAAATMVAGGGGAQRRGARPRLWGIIAALYLLGSRTAAAHPGATEELQQLGTRVHDDPQNVTLRVRYADAATRAGHLHEARAQARAITRLDPDEREVHRIRGEVWLARERPKAAEREFSEYLSDGIKNAGSGRVYAARARLHHNAGKLELARADYDSAIPLSPTPELILERGQVDDARNEPEELIAGYQEGLELLGPAVTVQLALIDAQRRGGHPRLALEQVDELLSFSPTRPDWILMRADLLVRLDQPVAGLIHRAWALYLAHRNLQRRPTQSNRLMLAQAESAFVLRDPS